MEVDRINPSTTWDRLALFVATGFGLGWVPFAPGTVGGLWGMPLAYGVAQIPWIGWRVGIILLICLIGIPICTRAARNLGRKDPGNIVLDEIASLPMTFFLIPSSRMNDPVVLALGFVLNRVFDISKPPPARQLERLPSGLGVMADDWAAGVYSCLLLHLCLWLPTWWSSG